MTETNFALVNPQKSQPKAQDRPDKTPPPTFHVSHNHSTFSPAFTRAHNSWNPIHLLKTLPPSRPPAAGVETKRNETKRKERKKREHGASVEGGWWPLLARFIRVWRRKQRHDSPFNPSPAHPPGGWRLVFPRVRFLLLGSASTPSSRRRASDRRERDVTDGFVGVARVFCSLEERRVCRPSKGAHNLSDWLPSPRQIYYEVTTNHAHHYHHHHLANSGWHSRRRRRRRRPPAQNDVGDIDATMAERKNSAGRSMDPSNGFRGWDYLWARLAEWLENVARVIRFGTAR